MLPLKGLGCWLWGMVTFEIGQRGEHADLSQPLRGMFQNWYLPARGYNLAMNSNIFNLIFNFFH